MFSTFVGFFSLYIPLVFIAVIGVWKEEKLVNLEQKIKRKIIGIFK